MFRFIAVAWDCADRAAAAAAQRLRARLASTLPAWRRVLDRDGLSVFVANSRAGMHRVCALDNAGVVLGTLFRRGFEAGDDSRPVTAFAPEEAAAIVRQGPGRLIELYWGWYVAFVTNATERTAWILRGPMSDLPCLHARYGAVSLFAAQAEDCVALNLLPFHIDWPLIQVQVGFGQAALVGQSAIQELSVVERGEAVEIRQGSTARKNYWNPCSLARSDCTDDPPIIRRALRATARSCIHAWASEHESIVHRLSGGLDSSLVLHCLADAPSAPRITCINYYWEGRHIDERAFARLIARHANVELVERELGLSERFDVLHRVKRTAAPVVDVLDWQEHGGERELVDLCEATAITTGSLGDALFGHGASFSPAADYLRARRRLRGFARVLMDVALRERVSIWKVLLFALRETWAPPKGRWSMHESMLRTGILKEEAILIGAEAIDEFHRNTMRYVHPWLRNVEGVPAGKLWLIAALFTEGFYDAHFRNESDPPVLAPYLSQPLVELCLRIPSYCNVRGGVDRAMVRDAFRAELPDPILRRSAKGSPDTWLNVAIDRDAKFIREFLLDGLLVRERVVDRTKLERTLPGTISNAVAAGGCLMNLLYTEAWLRAWSNLAVPVRLP